MAKITYPQQVVYKAVMAIESFGFSRLCANPKTIVAFVTGVCAKSIRYHFATKKDVFGMLPKANELSVIVRCSELVDKGYLRKTSVNGIVYYGTTGRNPLRDGNLLFTDTIPQGRQKLVDSIRTFVKGYCPNIIDKEKDNYLGFRLDSPDSTVSCMNWFWIAKSEDFKNLSFHWRSRPLKQEPAQYLVFNETNVSRVIEIIQRVLLEQERVFSLSIFPEKIFVPPSRLSPLPHPKPVDSIGKSTPLPTATCKINDFRTFAGDPSFPIVVTDGDNYLEALLSVGESSPFLYTEETYYSGEDVRKLVEDKKNFAFSMRQWKLIAWSASPKNPNFIRNVLMINKKTKTIWMVVSTTKKKVVCISKDPFQVEDGGNVLSPEEILTRLFGGN